jgi:hypothetical protein
MYLLTKRVAEKQLLHDSMVRALANELMSQGYYVYADISGFTQPQEIRGYIPDIIAVKEKSTVIAEAETCDTIDTEHTREQYKVFSTVPGTDFHVIVPESCLTSAQYYANIWGISVDYWWKFNGY